MDTVAGTCCWVLLAVVGGHAQSPGTDGFVIERKELKEASGVVASAKNPGWLWSHNDSGSGAFLYAIDPSRQLRLRLKVAGSRALDWEDIALVKRANDTAWLVIADTGRNLAGKRADPPRLWLVPEPSLHDVAAAPDARTRLPVRRSPRAHCLHLSYPEGKPPDVEAMFVFPGGRRLGFIAKDEKKKKKSVTGTRGSAIFAGELPVRTSADEPGRIRLERFGTLRLSGKKRSRLVTDAAVTPDGRLVVLTYTHIHLIELPPRSDKLPTLEPVASRKLPRLKQAEAVAVLDRDRCLVASEGKPARFIVVQLPQVASLPGKR